ncbi:MAG TPA: hypothetical protein VG965_04675 [Patescibacteria group bacterium]|nr:hypothetical protein [Patescibacteria group bacterium]
MTIRKLFRKLNFREIIPILLLLPFFAVIYKLYIPHVNSFGCFDDCFNFIGGYFIGNGKTIYHDFFFNHQLLPTFVSFLIQVATNPQNIYELVLRHRQFVILWSFLFSILLTKRFKLPAFLFVIIFELSKFYIFGDRFLAEALIVYPIIYLAGISLAKIQKPKANPQPLTPIDYQLSALFSWFIIFSREPYIPLAIFLTIVVFWGKITKEKKIAALIFALLTLLTFALFKFDFQEYWFNLVTFNFIAVLPADITTSMPGPRLAQAFLYPFYVFPYGNWNIFKVLLAGIDITFIILFANLIRKKNYQIAGLIFLLLGLANLRVIVPGTLFYAAFHMIIWYALFVFTTCFLLFQIKPPRRLFFGLLTILVISVIGLLSNKSYFGYERVDQQKDLLQNYGTVIQEGNVINALAKPGNTLFLDDSDDLIFWQSKLMSNYKYVWYTSQMPAFTKYTSTRLEMFKTNPPDFYREFGTCGKSIEDNSDLSLPDFAKNEYVRLYNLNRPSCLFIKKDIINKISPEQWLKAKSFLYGLKPIPE